MASDRMPSAPERVTVPHARGDQSCLEWEGPGGIAPVLHFAHANGFHAATYRRILSALSTQTRVIASDLRGHGQTKLPADPKTHRNWLVYRDDLIALLERLDAGPAVLAGHSMGATTSILVASARPDLVRSLVLFDPVMVPRAMFWRHRIMRGLGMKPMPPIAKGALARRAVFPSRAIMIKAYTGRGAFRTWPPDFLENYVQEGVRERADGQVELACKPAWEAANFMTGSAYDFWPGLKDLTCPVTVLRGTVNSTCREPQAKAFKIRVPQTKDRPIDGASHFLPMEQPLLAIDALASALY